MSNRLKEMSDHLQEALESTIGESVDPRQIEEFVMETIMGPLVDKEWIKFDGDCDPEKNTVSVRPHNCYTAMLLMGILPPRDEKLLGKGPCPVQHELITSIKVKEDGSIGVVLNHPVKTIEVDFIVEPSVKEVTDAKE